MRVNERVSKILRNPRGLPRPQDGRGKGVGMPGGRRQGRNTEPCPTGPGLGLGRRKLPREKR